MKEIRLKDFVIGSGAPLFFIMGPCVIEGEAITLRVLEELTTITADLGVPFVFKASYDKANRTSIHSYRGPGLEEGLKVLKKAREEFPSVPLITDVHCVKDIHEVSEAVDILQIPAFLCRQTDLLVEAGRTGRIVNIKKGQFMAPQDIRHSIEKVTSTGNENILVTERGVSFGYNNLVVDMRSIPLMRSFGWPVVFDATHSVQSPSGKGSSSGGDRVMARYLARAAAACSVDGIFMEVHPDPESALCDGPNSVALKDVKDLVKELVEIDNLVKGLSAV